jgi:hypothetical protein
MKLIIALLTWLMATSAAMFTFVNAQVHDDQHGLCPTYNGRYSFLIGQTTHLLEFNKLENWFRIDGELWSIVENITWHEIATFVLRTFHIEDSQFTNDLARDIIDLNLSILSHVQDQCHKHMMHGGIGILGDEDLQVLLTDPCCVEVYDEMLLFYSGNHF